MLSGRSGDMLAPCSEHIPLIAEQRSAGLSDQAGAGEIPCGTRDFHPLYAQLFAGALNSPLADLVALTAIGSIVHAGGVVGKVGRCPTGLLLATRALGQPLTRLDDLL